jgi:hypothetical protein
MKSTRFGVGMVCAAFIFVAGAVIGEEPPGSFADALKSGKAGLSFRYRFENVSDDAVASGKEAQASTLRTALSYRTAAYKNWSFYIEAENVTAVGDDSYNNRGAGSLSNGVTDRPVVADPAMTELNQAYGRWDNGTTKVTVGRQEILLGDQRYVGAVGWRQNHQSFDALSLVSTGVENWTFFYSFVDSVQRIFGDSQDMAGHLANAKYAWEGVGSLTLYGYLLDYDALAASGLSSSTFGAELVGKRALENGWSLLYELEAAQQSDAGDNPRNLDAGYIHAALGASGKVTVKAGIERLEGSPGDGQFRTPLATLHKFNGWADKFLATPANGLEDLYLQVAGKTAKGLAWVVFYHDFSSTEGGASYGTETDVQLTYKTSKGITLGLKGALYDADSHAADTDKWMLWTAYGFK